LTAEGSFEGGVILPGAQLMHDSLVARTAGIKSVFSASAGIVGKTTSECVNSGVLYGLGGAIDRVVEEMVKTLESSHVKDKSERIGSQVLVTGGGAPALRSRVMSNGQNHSDLVLLGVQEFAFQTTGFLS
jgi:type III pantothenate kinase